MGYSDFNDRTHKIWSLLSRTHYAVLKTTDREFEEYGLTTMQAMALLAVAHLYQATPAKVSRQIGRKSNTVSVLLDRLEKNGLVVRTDHIKARNWTRIRLTENGKRVLEQIEQDKKSPSVEVISSLTEEEQEQLAVLLEKVLNAALRQLYRSQALGLPGT